MVVIVLTTLSAQFKYVAPTSWRESRCTIYFIGIAALCHYKPEEVLFFFSSPAKAKIAFTRCPDSLSNWNHKNENRQLCLAV